MMNYDSVPPGYTIVGTCSKCGGNVCVPTIWGSTVPAIPTCSSCGATAKRNPHLPIIETENSRKIKTTLFENSYD